MADRSVVVRLRAEVADFKRQIEDSAKAVDKLPESAKRAETSLGRMVQSAERNRQAWDRAGASLATFGTLTLAGLGLATKAAVDWESAWTGVLKTVDGSASELAALEDSLREMARTLPATHQEIAAVAEAAGQLGVATKDVAAFTRTMIDLGETTNLTADEAATAIAQLMNVMQTAPDDVDNLGAALVQLGNNGASTERDIIFMAQRIAGAGEIIGLTEGEVLGFANALASVGIEVEAGGTAISKIMTDMAKAVSTGSEDLAKFAQVAGMSAEQFATAFEADPAAAIASFVEGLGRIDAAGGDVFTTLDELGQSEVRVTRALLTMANSGDLLRESLELGNEAWTENTALVAEAAKRYETAEAQLQIAQGAINDAAITIGEVFIPMLADAAGAVADLATWVGGLPEPLVSAGAGLTAVAGAAGLAAGAFLLTFPRVMETIAAFKALQTSSPATVTALSRVGKAAGLLAFAAVAVEIGQYIGASQVAQVEIEQLSVDLLALAHSAEEAGPALSDLFSKGADWSPWASKVETAEQAITSFASSAREALSENFWERLDRQLDFSGSEMASLRTEAEQLDAALMAMVDGGAADEAADVFERLTVAAEEQGVPVEKLVELFPNYTEATERATEASSAANDEIARSVEVLNEATGATELMTEAQAEWREGVEESMTSFISLLGAYDSVIQANIDAAQATADSTETSKDSWEDYYDGVSVGAADFITSLQEQVTAQENWAANITALSERVNTTMTGGMRDTANQMIDELLTLGPEGAAAVEAMKNMSDPELQEMVELYGRKGAAAAAEVTREIESHRPPAMKPIVLAPDTSAVYAAVDKAVRDNSGKVIWLDVRGRTSSVSMGPGAQVARADGGPIPGYSPHPKADNIPIWATAGEFMQSVPAVDFWGVPFMDAVNRRDAAAVRAALSGTPVQALAYGGLLGGGGRAGTAGSVALPETVRLDRASVLAVADAIVAGAERVSGSAIAAAARDAGGRRGTRPVMW